MTAGTDFSPTFTTIEDDYNSDDNVAAAGKDGIDDLRKSLNGRPPRNLSIVRHSISTTTLVSPSDLDPDLEVIVTKSPSDIKSSFLPVFQSGSCAEKGPKPYMEDDHICIDNLPQHLGEIAGFPSLGAFYGVFDGHGGTDAASFVRNNILKFIVEDSCFPACMEKAIQNAFLKAVMHLLTIVPSTYLLAPRP